MRTKTRVTRSGGIRLLAFMLAMVAFAVPAAAGAGQGQDPCGPRNPDGGPFDPIGLPILPDVGGDPTDEHNPLCPTGPAGCVAVGVHVEVAPNPALPFGATTQLSRSTANAFGFREGFGFSYSDAHQARADVPATLGAGAIESRCYAQSGFGNNYAAGDADIANVIVDLNTAYGIPVTLYADVLHEYGSSFNGFMGSNTANVADLLVCTTVGCVGPFSASQAPNTVIPLGPLGTLYLNEQMVSAFGPCPVWWGDAARLDITDPTTGATAAQVILSWVATSTCPPM